MAKKIQRNKVTKSKGGRQNVKEQTKERVNQATSVYTQNSRLVEDAGKLAFAQALGTSYSVGNYSVVNFNNTVTGLTQKYIAGAARIGVQPSYGGTLNPTSPINMATRSIYSFVRHANSGRANYEAADLMLYLLQMNEVLKLYSWFVRLYGISRTYSDKNRYYPRRIVESMGVNFDDLITNLASLRFQINVFANKLSSLNIPMNMPLFTESINMYSNLYLDGTDVKAQTYFFDPNTYYVFDATSSETGGMLREQAWIRPDSFTRVSVSALVHRLNQLLHSVLQNEDMNIMSGDILKAYGQENMLVLPQIPEDYVVYPIYDEMVLTQIENLSITERSNADITQEDQLLVSTPRFQSLAPTNTLGKILSFKWDNPTPAQVVDATRLAVITPVTSTSRTAAVDDRLRVFISDGPVIDAKTGTHIVTSVQIVHAEMLHHVRPYVLIDNATAETLGYDVYGITLATQFNYFPLRFSYRVNTANAFYELSDVVGDIQNYTILSKEDLDKVHEVAMLSLFGI